MTFATCSICFLFYAQAYRAQTVGWGGGGVKSAVKTPRARYGIRSNHQSINTGGFLCYNVSAVCTVLLGIQRGKTREICFHHVHQSITDYALFITNYQNFLKVSSWNLCAVLENLREPQFRTVFFIFTILRVGLFIHEQYSSTKYTHVL
jgi:hypothetical protein